MHFLIQTIDGEIKHDFSFTLLETIRYQNWYRNEQVCRFTLTDSVEPGLNFRRSVIPVGSVEFVSNYLEKHYNLNRCPGISRSYYSHLPAGKYLTSLTPRPGTGNIL